MATDLIRSGLARLGLLGALVVFAVGCGNHPRLTPVHGKITLSGKPIGPGNILFIPDVSKGTRGKTAIGYFESDGCYTMTTYEKDDGVIVGHHTVAITPRPSGAVPGEEFAATSRLPPIPLKYRDARRSPLKKEVKAGSSNLDFDLEP